MKPTNDNADRPSADPHSRSDSVGAANIPGNVPQSGESLLKHLRASIVSTILLMILCCGIYPLIIWGVAQSIFPRQANGSLVKKDGTAAMKDADAVGSSLLGQEFSQPGYFHSRPSAAGNSAGSAYSSRGGYDPTSSGGSNYGPLSDEMINGLVSAQAPPTTQAPTGPATQPAESLVYDGIRLRAIHYALENHIAFRLYYAVYVKHDDGSFTLERKGEAPLKTFQDAQGNLNDVSLVDAFPHPTTPDEYRRTVLIADDFGQPIPGDAVTASASGLDPHISVANARIQAARVASERNMKPQEVEKIIADNTDGAGLGFLGEPGVNVLRVNLALDAKYPIPPARAAMPMTQSANTATPAALSATGHAETR